MYFKEIETNAAAKYQHNKNMKEDSAARLRKNAEWNKRNK